MNFSTHSTVNHVFKPPEGVSEEACSSLPVTVVQGEFGIGFTSYWEPTPQELQALNEKGKVALTCMGIQPIVCVGVVPAEPEQVPT